MTFSIMTLNIGTFGRMGLFAARRINDTAKMTFSLMKFSTSVLCAILLSVVWLSDVRLSVVRLSREYQRGKYHCTVDLLFDWFGLVCFANRNKKMSVVIQLIPNQSNRRSTVQ
jgi:hypothetical protein